MITPQPFGTQNCSLNLSTISCDVCSEPAINLGSGVVEKLKLPHRQVPISSVESQVVFRRSHVFGFRDGKSALCRKSSELLYQETLMADQK